MAHGRRDGNAGTMRRLLGGHVLLCAAALAAVTVGCAGDGSKIPAPVGPGCSGLEPRLTCIQQMIFTPNCALSGCHDLATSSNGLTLEEGLSYGSLLGTPPTGMPSTWNPTILRVAPNNPDDSFLVIKLEATDPRLAGSPMPLNAAPLSAGEIQAIRTWIENGANDD